MSSWMNDLADSSGEAIGKLGGECMCSINFDTGRKLLCECLLKPKANIKGDIESNQIDMLVERNVHVKS